MQKYLWGGASLLVAGAAAIYAGADYMCRNPTSFVGRVGTSLTRAAVIVNPMGAVNRAVTGTDACRKAAVEVAEGSPVKPVCPVEPGDTIEPIQIEELPPATAEPPRCDPKAGIEESEWAWPVRAQDVVTGALDPDWKPLPMAYAYESGSHAWTLASLMRGWFGDECPLGGDGSEECESPASVNWLQRIFTHLRMQLSPVVDDIPVADMPVVPDLEEEGIEGEGEESEEQAARAAAEAYRSNQNYHHQGCPYMNCHPYPPQSAVYVPLTPPVEQPVPAVEPEAAEKPACGGCKKRLLKKKATVEQLIKRVSERRCFVPFVDTMEMRPSDVTHFPVPTMMPF